MTRGRLAALVALAAVLYTGAFWLVLSDSLGERHEGGEPPAGHGSSERTAAPLRSAFEMKPRAPLEAISPL